MSLSTITVHNREEAFRACLNAVDAAKIQAKTVNVLVQDYEASVHMKHCLAAAGASLGVVVSTLPHVVQDMWELWGDGRKLIGSTERTLLVRQALDKHIAASSTSALVSTQGTVALLEDIFKEGLPVLGMFDNLSKHEQEIVSVAQEYAASLAQHALLEYCDALAFLSKEGFFGGSAAIVLDDKLKTLELRFLETAAQVTQIRVEGFLETDPAQQSELNQVQTLLYQATGDNPVTAQGAVRFALPAGPYSTIPLLVQEIERIADGDVGVVALASDDPNFLFEALSNRIPHAYMTVAATVTFEQTDFGRAWCSIFAFLEEGEFPNTFLATDFALSPFSGLSVSGAFACDARWRGWRGQTVDEALTDLVGFAGDGYESMIALLGEGDIMGALQHIRRTSMQKNWPESYQAEQLQSMALAESIYETVKTLEGSMQDYLAALRQTSVQVSRVKKGNVSSKLQIEFLTHAELAKKPCACYDAVLLEGLDSSRFSIQEGEDAKDVLFKKAGIYQPCNRAQDLRIQFVRCLAAAKQCIVVSYSMTTAENDESLPAFFVEELIDCYRHDLSNPDELDKQFGVPAALLPYTSTWGDDQIGNNIAPEGKQLPLHIEVPVFSTGFLEHKHDLAESALKRPLSPSAIEVYLECPYKWFISRHVKSNALDAGFGPLEFGSFAHMVLEQFYMRLNEQGHLRVTEDNCEDAKGLLSQIFDAALSEQTNLPPQDALLISRNELEAAEVRALKKDLISFVNRESRFLPSYHPAGHEVVFGDESTCEYAGFPVHGRIDRYDVDGQGNAVIIDYKGSVNKSFAYGAEALSESLIPRKAQGLVYAQILRRQTGLMPQAVLYRSYRKPSLFGTYSHRAFHASRDLEDINADLCSVSDMKDTLDQVEEMIAERLQDFNRGVIDALPIDDDACTYCPLCGAQCSARETLFVEKGKQCP